MFQDVLRGYTVVRVRLEEQADEGARVHAHGARNVELAALNPAQDLVNRRVLGGRRG